jgi:hypothetical protein
LNALKALEMTGSPEVVCPPVAEKCGDRFFLEPVEPPPRPRHP